MARAQGGVDPSSMFVPYNPALASQLFYADRAAQQADISARLQAQRENIRYRAAMMRDSRDERLARQESFHHLPVGANIERARAKVHAATTANEIQAAEREALQLLEAAQAIAQTPPPGDAQRSMYYNGLTADLAIIQPHVKAGLLGANDVRNVVRSSLMSGLADERDVREAQKDLRAIQEGWRSGQFDHRQYFGAMENMQKHYGSHVLVRTPGYAEEIGMGSQIQAAKEEALRDYAEQHGVERRFVTWDAKESRPTYDRDEFAMEQAKATIANREASARGEVVRAAATAIKPDKPRRRDYANPMTGNVDQAAYDRDMQTYLGQHREYVKQLYPDQADVIDSVLPPQQAEKQAAVKNAPRQLVSSQPVDLDRVLSEVQAGRQPEGLYIDQKTGKAALITK